MCIVLYCCTVNERTGPAAFATFGGPARLAAPARGVRYVEPRFPIYADGAHRGVQVADKYAARMCCGYERKSDCARIQYGPMSFQGRAIETCVVLPRGNRRDAQTVPIPAHFRGFEHFRDSGGIRAAATRVFAFESHTVCCPRVVYGRPSTEKFGSVQ